MLLGDAGCDGQLRDVPACAGALGVCVCSRCRMNCRHFSDAGSHICISLGRGRFSGTIRTYLLLSVAIVMQRFLFI